MSRKSDYEPFDTIKKLLASHGRDNSSPLVPKLKKKPDENDGDNNMILNRDNSLSRLSNHSAGSNLSSNKLRKQTIPVDMSKYSPN